MKVSFVNRAGGLVTSSRFRGFVGRLAAFLDPPDGDLVILFCRDQEILRLNHEWRGKNRATDVLSFPGGGATATGRVHLGDIAVSVETAARQARGAGRSLAREIETLLAHGLLHLLGYDHETDDGTMLRLQAAALRAARSAGPAASGGRGTPALRRPGARATLSDRGRRPRGASR